MVLGISRWATNRTSGLSMPHAEGDGGHDNHSILAQKPGLMLGPFARVHAGVIGQRIESLAL